MHFNKIIIKLIFGLSLLISSSIFSQTTVFESLHTQSTFDAFTPNLNLDVGTTGGSLSPSNGNITYSVPIQIPIGTNSVMPKMTLNYTNSTLDGHLGTGWSLSGTSAIERGSKTIMHDGNIKAISLDDDAFYLDGSRLIELTTNTYTKEMHDYSKIEAIGSVGNDPLWFKVESKDGTILEYGKENNSAFYTEDGSEILSWKLSRILTNEGNYVEFKYSDTDRDHRLISVDYTGNINTGLTPYNSIKFNYSERGTHTIEKYQAESIVRLKYLIDNIEVKNENNALVKRYEMTYASDNINVFLKEITEVGSNYNKLNPTIFKYGNEANLFEYVEIGDHPPTNQTLYTGDFNGDGYTDKLAANFYIDDGEIYNDTYNLWTKDPSPDNEDFDFKFYSFVSGPSLIGHSNQYSYLSSDFTGEGRDDILFLYSSPNNTFMEVDGVILHEMQENAESVIEVPIQEPVGMAGYYDPSNTPLLTGDFNGDGVTDVILILANEIILENGTFELYLSDYKAYIYKGGVSTEFEEISISGSSIFSLDDWDMKDIKVIDMDGDGKNDLLFTSGLQSEVFTMTASNTIESLSLGLNYPTTDHLVFFGDFNGDKKTDVLSRANKYDMNSAWEIAYSDGNSFTIDPDEFEWDYLNPIIDENYSGDIIYTGDLNGDGRSDIATGYNFVASQRITTYFNKGEEWVFDVTIIPEAVYNNRIGAQDFNGDGKMELVTLADNGVTGLLKYKSEGQEFQLQDVKNGLGIETNISYSRMTEMTNYERTEFAEHPLNNVQFPSYLVNTIEQEGLATESFIYKNAKLHKEGRGLLGFEEIIKQTTNSFNEVSKFVFEPVHKLWLHEKTEQYNSANLLKNNAKVYDIITKTDGTIDYYIQNVTADLEINFFTGTNKTKSSTFDDFGNVLVLTENINGIETKTTTTQFEKHGGPVPNKPVSIHSSTVRTGQAPYVNQINKTYNLLGQMTTKVVNIGDPKAVSSVFSYNSFGNLIETSLAAPGLSTRTNSQTYDPYGRYAISKTNALNQTATYSYHDKFGTLASMTTIGETTTYYYFDAWGRKIKTTFPLGFAVEEIYDWASGYAYKHTLSHPGASNVSTFYDKQLREVRKEQDGFNQTKVETSTYDNLGNVLNRTDALGFTSSFIYDIFNRPETITTNFDVTTLDYSFSNGNLVATKNNATGETTQITDATGKIISSEDFGGLLNYTYHSNGKVKDVIRDGVVLSSTKFDNLGRQTELSDINAGTTIYEYDAYGQLLQEISPSNNITIFTYNKIGNILSRSGAEGTTTYDYHQHGGDINLVKSVNGFGGDIESYTYDNYGRLTDFVHTMDGNNYVFSYEYDQYDNRTKKTFPSGFELKYIYDSNGYLDQITNASGSQVIYDNMEMNALDQDVKYKSVIDGETQTIDISYNFSFPTQITNGTKNILDYNWNYATGNLDSRTTNYVGLANHTENFVYDDLNRLESHSFSGSVPLNTVYDDNGNILSKDDAGLTYGYDPDKINAVNCIEGPNTSNLSIYNQDIIYTTFYQPETIIEDDYAQQFTYNSGQERLSSVLTKPDGSTDVRYYLGDYESFNGINLHYVNIGRGIHMVIERNGSTDTYHRAMTDYQGSVLYLGETNGNEYHFNYDAWGRDRSAEDLSYLEGAPDRPSWFNRGYTGHEHLYEFQIINMNGRLYDPVIGRMLSPDNHIQATSYTQNYNRYSYALNNPLKYTDPNGEFLALAIFGVLLNGHFNIASRNSYFDGWAGAAVTAVLQGSNITGLSLSPSLSTGSGGLGIGFNLTFNLSPAKYFHLGLNYGMTYHVQHGATNVLKGTRDSGLERRFGYGLKFGTQTSFLEWGGTRFSGLYPQKTGFIKAQVSGAYFTFDNDVNNLFGLPLDGDNGDRYRTSGVKLGFNEAEVGLLMFTGDPGLNGDYRNVEDSPRTENGQYGVNNITGDNPDSHRMGVLYFGVAGYRLGYNSEYIRDYVQNQKIHEPNGSAYFKVLNVPSSVYLGFYTNNPFTTW